jgi:hypothetical protein
MLLRKSANVLKPSNDPLFSRGIFAGRLLLGFDAQLSKQLLV